MTKSEKTTAISGNFKNKDIISLDQFSPKDLQLIFSLTSKIKKAKDPKKLLSILKGKVVTLLFYEPSSRTYASFASSVKRLGGKTIDVLDPQHFSSVSKGETLEDTSRVFETYSDAIVLRHPIEGSVTTAANCTKIPVINAGDGAGEHPTQALLDLFTIYEKHKKLQGLTGVLAGDLLNGRTIHSLTRGLCKYAGNTLYLLSPKELRMKRSDFLNLCNRGIKLIEIDSEKNMPDSADFWYWTRVQKERFKTEAEYKKVKNKFVIDKKLIKEKAGQRTIIMHPLPRVGEIKEEVDSDPRCIYLTDQIKNGMYTRMALLMLIFNKQI